MLLTEYNDDLKYTPYLGVHLHSEKWLQEFILICSQLKIEYCQEMKHWNSYAFPLTFWTVGAEIFLLKIPLMWSHENSGAV